MIAYERLAVVLSFTRKVSPEVFFCSNARGERRFSLRKLVPASGS